MTKLDFPDTPSTGQQYGSSGTVWRWDGTRWGSTAGAAGARGCVAYSQAVVDQTGVTTAVDLNGLVISFPVTAGRRYLITSKAMLASTAIGAVGQLTLAKGATQLQQASYYSPVGNAAQPVHIIHSFTAAVTETFTCGIRLNLVSGGGAIGNYAAPTYPSFIMAEDITYEAGSGGPVGPYVTVAELSQYPRIEVRGGVPLANNSVTSVMLNAWAALTYSVGPAGQWGGGGAGTIMCKAPYAGRWNFSYSVNWLANGTGARQSWLGRSDGVRFGQQMVGPSPIGADTIHTGAANIMLTADQWVGLYVYQSSGAVLNVATTSESYFMGYYLGPA